MDLKLRMLQGQFQKASGKRSDEIAIRRPMFFIGSDASCNLKCPSPSVSPRHCAIMVDGEFVTVHDLNSQSGVFLNDHQINGSALLANGDLIRVGTLEFELVAEGVAVRSPEEDEAKHAMEGDRWRGAPDMLTPEPPPEDIDKMDGDITEMLQREDESARKHRLSHPDELRYDTTELKARNRALIESEIERANQNGDSEAAARKKKKPGKLPKSPSQIVKGSDATEAAQEMLSRVFKPRP